MKRFALAAPLVALLGGVCSGCASTLATLPPTNTYVRVEGGAPQLTDEERDFLEAINRELQRLGMPAASPSSYEMNEAAVIANVALAKVWNGSGRAIAEPTDLTETTHGTQEGEARQVGPSGARELGVSDEEDDTELKHLHVGQHLLSRGLIPADRTIIWAVPYAETALEYDVLKKLVLSLNPGAVSGDLVAGVAVLPAGDADQRIFVAVVRDRVLDLEEGPPRTTAAGGSFRVAGRVLDASIGALKVALLGPDGSVTLRLLPLDDQHKFVMDITLPTAPGLYTLSLRSAERDWGFLITLPIFAGVPPTPWPPSADPNVKTAPVDGTRALAQRLAQVLLDFRKSHNLPPVPIDANLSAYAKGEALARGKVVDALAEPGATGAWREFQEGFATRIHAAGFDAATVHQHPQILGVEDLDNFFQRLLGQPLNVADLASPTLEAIGIGVVLQPNEITKAEDVTAYSFDWMTKDPTPPQYRVAGQEAAPPAAAPATPPPPSASTPVTPTPVAPAPPSGAAPWDAIPPSSGH